MRGPQPGAPGVQGRKRCTVLDSVHLGDQGGECTALDPVLKGDRGGECAALDPVLLRDQGGKRCATLDWLIQVLIGDRVGDKD